jgi:hypothetical protein
MGGKMNKYGPNSPQVELFIERLKVMTDEEVRVADTRAAAWAAWDAARDAETIVVMDLITLDQFAILPEPFAEILVELGIAWEGK